MRKLLFYFLFLPFALVSCKSEAQFTLPHDHTSLGKGGPLGDVEITSTGTITAEQITSTDDMFVTDDLDVDGWVLTSAIFSNSIQLPRTGTTQLTIGTTGLSFSTSAVNALINAQDLPLNLNTGNSQDVNICATSTAGGSCTVSVYGDIDLQNSVGSGSGDLRMDGQIQIYNDTGTDFFTINLDQANSAATIDSNDVDLYLMPVSGNNVFILQDPDSGDASGGDLSIYGNTLISDGTEEINLRANGSASFTGGIDAESARVEFTTATLSLRSSGTVASGNNAATVLLGEAGDGDDLWNIGTSSGDGGNHLYIVNQEGDDIIVDSNGGDIDFDSATGDVTTSDDLRVGGDAIVVGDITANNFKSGTTSGFTTMCSDTELDPDINWQKSGDVVTLEIFAGTNAFCTSDDATFMIEFGVGGLPDTITPTNSGWYPTGVMVDNGNINNVYVFIGSDVIHFSNGLTLNSSNWSSSGAKGFVATDEPIIVTYRVN